MSKAKVSRLALIAALIGLLAVISFSTAAQEVVTVEYWDYWVTQGAAVDAAIEAFEEANPGIEVNRTLQGGGNYNQVVQAAFTAGPDSTPDVFVLPDPPTFPEILEAGWLMPLNDFADFEEWRASVPNPDYVFLDGAGNTVDGLTYSAKFWSDNVWIKMFVNTDVYEAAGLTEDDFPVTLDQLIENSRVITENTDAYGVGFSGTQTWAQGWWIWMCQFSTQLYTHAPQPGWNWVEGRYDIASDECANASLNGLVTLRDEGLIHPESVNLAIDDEAARVLFAEGQFAHLIAGDWVIGGWATTNPEFDGFRIIPLPLAGVEEQGGSFQYGPGGRWFGIAADTEVADAAWEWFKFLHSPEFASIWIQYADEGLYRMDPEEFAASNPVRADIAAINSRLVTGPNLGLRAPDTAQVVFTLEGPDMNSIVNGVFTGQIEVEEALADFEARIQASFDQGLADAQAAGLDVELEDYIFADWIPTEDYVQAAGE